MSGGHLPRVRHALTSHRPHPTHAGVSQQPQLQPAIAPSVWNHLQVPNFYPRQPQAAHMSSERPLSRSPLTWHTPTPPDRRQPPKGAPNPFRHAPTPPDVRTPKGSSIPFPDGDPLEYRHTPTPPDGQGANPFFRHTPTPPDLAHAIKDARSPYGRTPPPDGHKGPPNPLFNLQQMIASDGPRDNFRGDALGFSRLSPGLALGSMDLSVTRSPRNGGQNGDAGVPIGLSVRDATRINSLDSAEIAKMRAPAGRPGAVESPTPSSNGPRSPRRRPVKKVDSILERLNSGADGVSIAPVPRAASPRSVIVSARRSEDGDGSSPSTFAPAALVPNRATLEIRTGDGTPPAVGPRDPAPPESPRSSPGAAPAPRGSPNGNAASRSNEDSNGSSSDGGGPRRRRKRSRTTRVEAREDSAIDLDEDAIASDAPQNLSDPKFGLSNVRVEDPKSPAEDRAFATATPTPTPTATMTTTTTPTPETNETAKTTSPARDVVADVSIGGPTVPEGARSTDDDDAALAPTPTPTPKPRRKTSSGSETIDDIAAMIASTASDARDSETGDSSLRNPSRSTPDDSTSASASARRASGSPTGGAEPERVPDESDARSNDAESERLPKEEREERPKTIVEVENELEKMFAGIEENKSSASDEFSARTADAPNEDEKSPEKSRRPKRAAGETPLGGDGAPKKRRRATGRKSSVDSNEKTKKKSKFAAGKNRKIVKKTEALPPRDAYDSGSNASSGRSRGPYVQIKGPRDSPLSVSVINTPIQEEDADRPLQKIRNLKGKTPLSADANFRNKVKSRGLHSSTLSTKYDATTTDASWICVFCKRGPHTRYDGNDAFVCGKTQYMGDLFGPYVITTDCPDYDSMLADPHDSSFKGKFDRRTSLQSERSQRGKRAKSEPEDGDVDVPDDDARLGMTEAGRNSFEVWLHEDCAVWAPGLYLVGPKLVGLEAAVWTCCTIRCDMCSNTGATVACIKRGCRKTMHVNCARTDRWSLSEENFIVYCKEHKLP